MTYETGVINEFGGEHFFLSNYSTTPFMWRGLAFRSGEQAFAFAKTYFMEEGSVQTTAWQAILDARTPGEAKKLGRRASINVDEWDKHKVQYMREIVHAKFRTGQDTHGHGIVGPLCNTGARMLVEGNDWQDFFWGRCKDKDGVWKGLNTLGVILMEERGFWNQQKACPECKTVL